jgi:hypothetical protein
LSASAGSRHFFLNHIFELLNGVVMFANSAAAARIPSWFEFIRFPRLLGRPCQVDFAGVWFRHEKPLRIRAGPAGAAQAFMTAVTDGTRGRAG